MPAESVCCQCILNAGLGMMQGRMIRRMLQELANPQQRMGWVMSCSLWMCKHCTGVHPLLHECVFRLHLGGTHF